MSGLRERQQQQQGFEGGGVRRWLGLSFPLHGWVCTGTGNGASLSGCAEHMNITGHTASLEPQLSHDPSIPFSTEAPPPTPPPPPTQQQQARLISLGPGVSLCKSFQQGCPRGLETPVCPTQIRAPPALRSAFLTGPQDLPLLLLGSNTEQGTGQQRLCRLQWGRGLGYLSLSPLSKREAHLRDGETSTFNRLFLLTLRCVPCYGNNV